VDGFHPLNIGALCMKGRDPLFVPCTPKGCIELLDRMGVEMKGKHAVVLGRSNIVGMPAALLLLKRDATVSIVHSRTVNPEAEVRRADILIACCGQAQIVSHAATLCFPGVPCISLSFPAFACNCSSPVADITFPARRK
jgi:5,10-methylene-tetrahydrofolate dehydrogenase/methenyl tetrahydrofolate cyclohydrolase